MYVLLILIHYRDINPNSQINRRKLCAVIKLTTNLLRDQLKNEANFSAINLMLHSRVLVEMISSFHPHLSANAAAVGTYPYLT